MGGVGDIGRVSNRQSYICLSNSGGHLGTYTDATPTTLLLWSNLLKKTLLTGIAALFLATGLVGCSHPLRLDLDGFTSQQRQEQRQSKQDECIVRGGSSKECRP
jgi:hypothetical protein